MNEKQINERKEDHIRINAEEDITSLITNGLDDYYFDHQALPELDLDDVDITTTIFGKKQNAPIFISSMVGGSPESYEINLRFARAAQKYRIGMGVGSQRIGLALPDTMRYFNIRSEAPDILLFANIGAIQLNNSVTTHDCVKLVDEIGANGLILHLNPLQEALQLEGNTNFAGLLNKLEKLCSTINVPVVVKEVGWGISGRTAKYLNDAGVAAIDVAGAGGTSWSEVEKYRLKDDISRNVAASFHDWGISTAQSILNVKENTNDLIIFASGGLRSGIDVAKCIALGADYCGFAGKLFRAAVISEEKVNDTVEEIMRGLQLSMFAAGTGTISLLQKTTLRKR